MHVDDVNHVVFPQCGANTSSYPLLTYNANRHNNLWRFFLWKFRFCNIPFVWDIADNQSSAVVTRSNLSRYYIRHCDDSGRKWIRFQNHNRHPISRPQGRAMGVYCQIVRIWEKIDCVITAPHCGNWLSSSMEGKTVVYWRPKKDLSPAARYTCGSLRRSYQHCRKTPKSVSLRNPATHVEVNWIVI